jgi:hypothetical protein
MDKRKLVSVYSFSKIRRIHNIYKNKISILSGALLKLILVQIVEFVCTCMYMKLCLCVQAQEAMHVQN